MDRNTTLWCSYAVEQISRGKEGDVTSGNIFHAGYDDTAQCINFLIDAFMTAAILDT